MIRALVFRIGKVACALRLNEVSEVLRCLPIEPIAGVSRLVKGISVIRGEATPVVDLSALVHLQSAEVPFARFVLVRIAGQRPIALAVTEVDGIRNFPAARLQEMPPLLSGASTEAVSALAASDQELLLVLEGSRIVTDVNELALEDEPNA